MQPLMYSTIEAKNHNIGWQRCGDNIALFKNDDNMIYYKDNRQGLVDESDDGGLNNCSYTLTFQLEVKNENDTIYFAHSYPYTYSTLQHYLMNVEQDPEKSKYCKLGVLCRSLAGNNIYCLSITAPPSSEDHKQKVKIKAF